MSRTESIVKVENLHKSFKLPNEQTSGIKQMIINLVKHKQGYEIQHVLKDISFEVKKGEFFGIVGRNGSGKSTLLKLLAGIYVPDSGHISIDGSLTPFIELGVGFNPELTGRENVFLNGALLGFDQHEMDVMYDEIVEFAELEKFMDQKLKNYSSGMQVRLAFSIAIRAKSDVLILDEVLAVGDQAFQQKCFDYFETLKKEKKTVILVTHDMGAVKQFCDRALMIENGIIKTIGLPYEVSLDYEKANFNKTEPLVDKSTDDILIKTLNEANKQTSTFEYGKPLILSVQWPHTLKVGIAGFVVSKNGEEIFATNTIGQAVDFDAKKVSLTLQQHLGNGRYRITAGLFGDNRHNVLRFIEGPEITIFNQPTADEYDKEWHGVAYIENEWSS
jgi:ABC-2 type transport system ATP-binding protein